MKKITLGDFIESVIERKEFIRNGHIVVNPIGEATYVDIERVTPEELKELYCLKLRAII